MKRKLLSTAIILILLVSLLSCELFLEKPPKPTIHALFISLDYHETQKVIIDAKEYDLGYLPGVITDIEEVAVALNLLSEDDYFNMEINNLMLVEKSGYSTPTDRIPSKANVQSVIESFQPGGPREIGEHDIFLLYYAGHGGDTGQPLLLADPEIEDYGSYLTTNELNQWVGNIAGKKIIILDTCHSGQIITNYPRSADERESPAYDPHTFYLSASTTAQLSQEALFPEIGQTHGYFTLYFLNAIGWNHLSEENTEVEIDGQDISVQGKLGEMEDIPSLSQGSITISKIYQYIINNFMFAQHWISSQTPQTGDGPLDLILFSESW